MINRYKFGKCSQCGDDNTDVIKVRKDLFCVNCHKRNKAKEQATRANQRASIRQLYKKQDFTVDRRAEIAAQEKWFADIAKEIDLNANCWECGSKIYRPYYRAASAHIFPKNIFHSVATHPLNYVVAGAGCGCHQRTHRLDTFSQMKIFREAVDRFREFEHMITEKHKYLNEFIDLANTLHPIKYIDLG